MIDAEHHVLFCHAQGRGMSLYFEGEGIIVILLYYHRSIVKLPAGGATCVATINISILRTCCIETGQRENDRIHLFVLVIKIVDESPIINNRSPAWPTL